MAEEKPHYSEHRKRLRARLLEKGAAALSDQEILEYLLFGALPRRDVKPYVKALIAEFGGLAGVLTAEPKQLMQITGIKETSAALLTILPEAARRLALEEAKAGDVLSSWDTLLAYCRIAMAHETREQFRLLFLDKKNRLIADEVQQTGTVDHTPVYPREVVKRALELDASALILVHNHPSGDPAPSQADIALTQDIKETAGKLGIALHDHLIIGKGGHSSFRALGLL